MSKDEGKIPKHRVRQRLKIKTLEANVINLLVNMTLTITIIILYAKIQIHTTLVSNLKTGSNTGGMSLKWEWDLDLTIVSSAGLRSRFTDQTDLSTFV